MRHDFDLAVIGAGASGLSVTAVAARLGLRVALVERGRMGGDCLNTGCVPSKALLASAHAALDTRRWTALGLRGRTPDIDWDGVQAHVRGVIEDIAPADSETRFTALGATVLRGDASFTSPATVEVQLATGGTRSLSARRFVVAAGSRAAVPDINGLSSVPYVTHEHLFEIRPAPEHLLILGGGPIGLEMAQAHAGLGCRVTVVEAARIALRDDPELVGILREILTRDGVTILEGATVIRVEAGPALVLADGRRVVGSRLLVATGRRPNIEGLGLEVAGIRAGPAGIATDLGLRSVTNRRVFAIGDIADPDGLGPRAYTHVGSYHASVVIRRALFRLPARIDYAALPRAIYTAPEMAQVGLTEAEALAAGHRVCVARWPLSENDRARTEGQPAGLAKLVVTPRGRILGAGFVAPHAGEMIGAWTIAIARRIKLANMASQIVAYPTIADIGKRAAGGFFEPRLFARFPRLLVRLLARMP